MAAYLRGVLSSLLSRFVTQRDEALQLDVWGGRLLLRDVELCASALPLPLLLRHARLAQLELAVPWTRLVSESVAVKGRGLRVQIDKLQRNKSTDASPTPPPPPPNAGALPEQEEEVAALLRHVKRRLQIDLQDVLIMVRDRVCVRAVMLTSGPFGLAEDGTEDDSNEYSQNIKLTGLSVEIDGVLVLHPVSADVVLSFSAGSRLNYCNIVVTEELKLCLSDFQIELLQSLCGEIFEAFSADDTSSSSSSAATDVPPVVDAPSPLRQVVASDAPVPPPTSHSWTSSIWNYGMSWVSSAVSAPSLTTGSPAKRLGPRRPASSGNLTALESSALPPGISSSSSPASSASASSSFLPSWFRFELPLFSLELSRHARVAVDEQTHSVPRSLMRLQLQQNLVEWSQSPLALELIARVGMLTVTSLWENQKEGTPVLLFDSDEDVLALEWVHRLHDRFVNVLVEPLVLCPSAALIREMSVFIAEVFPSSSPDEETHANHDYQSVVAAPPVAEDDGKPKTLLNVTITNPRVLIGDFDVCVGCVRVSPGQAIVENVRIVNRVSQLEMLMPVEKVSVEIGGKATLIKTHGVVGLRFRASELRALIVAVEALAIEASDDLPEYAGLFGGRATSRLKHHEKSSTGRVLELQFPRACVLLEDKSGSPVADALLDQLLIMIAHGTISGSVLGAAVLDRSDAACGNVLLSTFVTEGMTSALYAQAYAQLTSKHAFAADLLFSSPNYKHSAASGEHPVSFTYCTKKSSLDAVPQVSTTVRIHGLRVHYERSVFSKLSSAVHLGASGLDEEAENRLSTFSAARLKWHFIVQKALRFQRRKVLESSDAVKHSSWSHFLAHVGKLFRVSPMLCRAPSWSQLSFFLQAAASNLQLEISDTLVMFPGNFHLSVKKITSSKQLNDRGFPFDWTLSKTLCSNVSLMFSGDFVACQLDAVSIVGSSRLNGDSSTAVDLGQWVARIQDPSQITLVKNVFRLSKPPEHSANRPPKRIMFRLVSGAASLSMRSFVLAVESLVFADGELFGSKVVLLHEDRGVASAKGIGIKSRHVSSTGLRVVLHRDALDEFVALIKDLRGEPPSNESPSPPSSSEETVWMLLARDSCVSLPLGKQSALHLNVERVKGAFIGELRWKGVCIYFGALQQIHGVIGGMIKLDRGCTSFSPQVDLDLGKLEVLVVLAVDFENVRYLLSQYGSGSTAAKRESESEKKPSSLPLGKIACKELFLSCEALALVLEDCVAESRHDWSGSLRVGTLMFQDQTLVVLRDLHRVAGASMIVKSLHMCLYLSQAEHMVEICKRVLTQSRRDGPSSVPADNPRVPRLFFPPDTSVPELSLLIYAFPGSDAVLQLHLVGLGCSSDPRNDTSLRVRLHECRGLVVDTLSGSQLQFFDARSVLLRCSESEMELSSDEPICLSLSSSVLQCVTALRRLSAVPLFPFVVENVTGYPLILSGGRRCEPYKSVGVDRTPGRLHLMVGGSTWRSSHSIDFAAVSSKRVLSLETAEGDLLELMVSRMTENMFRVSGKLLVVNATQLSLSLQHAWPLSGRRVLSEVIFPNQKRHVSIWSEKGKEEDEAEPAELFASDASAAVSAVASPALYVMVTPRSTLRFRVQGRNRLAKWSEQLLNVSADDSKHEKTLVACDGGIFLWCSSLAGGIRLSAIAVLDNHLPCPIFWAAVDGQSRGCIPSGSKAQYFGKPDEMVFGFSLVSEEQAVSMQCLVDGLKPRSAAPLANNLTLNVACFTVASTQTRHLQLSCSIILKNSSSWSVLFGSEMVAGRSSVACDDVPACLGSSEADLSWIANDDDDKVLMGADGQQQQLSEDHADEGKSSRSSYFFFRQNGLDQEVIVHFYRLKESKTRVVEVSPCLEIANETRFAMSMVCKGVLEPSELLRGAGAVSFPPWLRLDSDSFRLVHNTDQSNDIPIEFGTVKLVRVANGIFVLVRTHFRPGEQGGLPRVIRVSLLEPSPIPFIVHNLTPWNMGVQEQWGADVTIVHPGTQISIFPSMWREYLSQQRESMEEALDRLSSGGSSDKKKSNKIKGGGIGDQRDESFPASIRKRPFVFRIRMDPGGNWSELIESSRPHFFSMQLYSEQGSVQSTVVSISFVGLTKVIRIGGHVSSVPRPLMSWKLALSMLCVRATGLAEVIAKRVSVSKRGVALEFSIGEIQVQNLVAGATYPLLLFQLETTRPAILARARLGHEENANLLSKVSLALSDLGLELDYGSLATLLSGLAAMFKGESLQEVQPQHPSPASPSPPPPPLVGLVDEVEAAPFVLLLSWQNPKILIPLQLWDEMLSIRHLKLSMPGFSHSGCSLSSSDLKEILGNYAREAFVGQTVRILGSLDVLGNPTGLITAFGSSVRFLQSAWTAAIEGDGHAMVEGASDAVRSFAGALMTPLVSLSNASARIVGDEGALGAIFDLNRRTIEFVSGYLTAEQNANTPAVTQSPFKDSRRK